MSIRFSEQDVRQMGRSATGVKGITLSEGDEVNDMDIAYPDHDVMIVTAKGYGKRTPLSEYRQQSRGGKGIKTLTVTEKNGPIVGLKMVTPREDLMLVTNGGVVIRLNVSDISQQGRYTQGVKLITLREGEEVATVARVHTDEEEE
jgi:DNA gyrase subunit A